MSATAMGMALDVIGISPRAKLVLIAVCNSADEATFEGFPSRKHLARAADCSVDTVDRCLRELSDGGLLQKSERTREDGKAQSSNLYRVFPSFDPSRRNAAPRIIAATGGNAEVRPPQPQAYAAPPAAQDAAPRTVIEPSINNAVAAVGGREVMALVDEALTIASGAANLTSADVHHGRVFRQLLAAGCTRDDIIDAVTGLSAAYRERKRAFHSWAIIADAAQQNRDRRLAGLPAPSKPSEQSHGRTRPGNGDADAWDAVCGTVASDAADRPRPSVAMGKG